MRIGNISTKILKNKRVLGTLEKISEHGISVSAGASLLMSVGVRPLAVWITPDTEKENKQYAMANSICSGLVKFGIIETIALPVELAIKKIDKNPKKFLTHNTLKNLKTHGKQVPNSRAYKLITQTLKLSTGFATAIPKAMLTIALIPIIMDNLFFKNLAKNKEETNIPAAKSPNFTGRLSNGLSKKIALLINNEKVQKYALKLENKDHNIPKHITASTDILLTASSVHLTNKSKGIKENRKKALIYNNIISTAITISGGYIIDRLLKNKSTEFIKEFSKMHKNNPKLPKYIEGLHILRPALIFAGIYYGILPIFSTYFAEKIDKYIEKHSSAKS